MSTDEPNPPSPTNDPHRSDFRLEISIAIGYQRKRAAVAGKWEGPLTSMALLVGGIIVVLFVLYRVFQIQL